MTGQPAVTVDDVVAGSGVRGNALAWLTGAARDRAAAGLHRDPIARGPADDLIDLASNDYLGLSRHPRVSAAATAAIADFGAGATASRLVVGTTTAHVALEQDLADFLGYASALVFSSGYLANLGAITALAGRGDLIVSDTGTHASLIDGCRLSRARVVVVDRGDAAAVARTLAERTEERALVVTDSIYSVDGRPAPLRELYGAAREHGAVLLVDEAHALGVIGPGGRGLLAELGLAGAPDLVTTAVLSKSMGTQGGVVLGPAPLRGHLIDTARTFIFDTGLTPAAVGAAAAALQLLREQPQLPERLRANVVDLADRLGVAPPEAAVISVIIGAPETAVAAAAACRARGVAVGCFRPPSVPAGTSRLRLTVRADLTAAEIDRVATVVTEVLAEAGVTR